LVVVALQETTGTRLDVGISTEREGFDKKIHPFCKVLLLTGTSDINEPLQMPAIRMYHGLKRYHTQNSTYFNSTFTL